MNSKNCTALGFELAKHVFHHVVINRNHVIVEQGKWSRRQLLLKSARELRHQMIPHIKSSCNTRRLRSSLG